MDPVTISGAAKAGGLLAGLGVLSKPINTLIEKISDATGVVYEPRRIVRQAQANAKAEVIRAQSAIEVDEFQARALTRLLAVETRKLENADAITEKAFGELAPNADASHISNDWIAHFFSRCELISDPQMQSLWGHLLASEANSPGSFSKKTTELVSSLEKSDAELFTKLCRFSWALGSERLNCPLVFDLSDNIYSENGLTFESITHLEALGLLTFNVLSDFRITGMLTSAALGYFGDVFVYTLSNTAEQNHSLGCGKVLLSQAGQQLARIAGARRVPGFSDYVLLKWKEAGINVQPRPDLMMNANGTIVSI